MGQERRGAAQLGRQAVPVDGEGGEEALALSRLLALVRADRCDVAVGSRFVSGDGYEPYRYLPSGARRFGTAVLRRAMGLVLRRPFGDATSGLWAVNATALPVLARPFTTAAPEVEALIRLADGGLRVEEVYDGSPAKEGGLKPGDLIVLTIGEPIGKAGGTNTMKIVKVGEHRA